MPFADRGTRLPPQGVSRPLSRRLAAGAAILVALLVVEPLKRPRAADNPPTVADVPSSPATVQPRTTPFQTEEISIGQPITLPLAAPTGPAPTAAPPGDMRQAPETRDAATAGADAGSGWLGLAVDDTLLTGRLVVVEVAPDSPAARAGVRPQDLLLAINGNTLQNSDQMAAALAAITPDQRVKMAIARDNRVEDVVAVASRRPAAAARGSQPTEAVAAIPETVLKSGSLPSAAPPATTPAPPRSAGAASDWAGPTTSGAIQPPPAMPALPLPAGPADGFAAASPAPERFPLPPADPTAQDHRPPAFSPAAASPMPGGAGSSSPSTVPAGRTALGVRTIPVDSNVQSRFHLTDKRGAFVIGVVHDLPASKAGVPPGSVIVAINQQPVGSPQELTRLVAGGPVGRPVSLHYVLPGGESKEAAVVLQPLDSPLERVLVGGEAGVEPHRPQPEPSLSRRPAPAAVPAESTGGPNPLVRLEAMLRRINGRLEQIERRLDSPR